MPPLFPLGVSLGPTAPPGPSMPSLSPSSKPGGSSGSLPSKPQRPSDEHHPNVAFQFSLEIEGLELQYFAGCEGLMAEYDIQSYEAGGINDYVVKLPGRVKYGTVKFTRYLTQSSSKVAAWFTDFHKKGAGRKRQTATVTMYSVEAKPICKWVLKDIHPVKWTGPNFTLDGNALAKETLEVVHHGFRQTGLMSMEG